MGVWEALRLMAKPVKSVDDPMIHSGDAVNTWHIFHIFFHGGGVSQVNPEVGNPTHQPVSKSAGQLALRSHLHPGVTRTIDGLPHLPSIYMMLRILPLGLLLTRQMPWPLSHLPSPCNELFKTGKCITHWSYLIYLFLFVCLVLKQGLSI